MLQGEEEIQAARLVGNDLEPYRRLIELQRQMIQLVQQHEKTKHECRVLRERLSREMAVLRRTRLGWRHRMNKVALRWARRSVSLFKTRAWKRLQQCAPFLRARTP